MASTNIKIFDENKGNLMADEAYAIDTQRVNGVQSGIASSQLQNKTLFQVSLMAYALAQIMNQNGIDANDYDAVSTFVNNLSSSLLQKVNDKASTAQAQAGTDNTKWMTPALVKAWWDNMYNSFTLPVSKLTGVLPVPNGGTGQNTATKSMYVLGNSGTTMAAAGMSSSYLIPLVDTSASASKKVTVENLLGFLTSVKGVARIDYVSYTGTGESSKTITFDFTPRIVVLFVDGAGTSGSYVGLMAINPDTCFMEFYWNTASSILKSNTCSWGTNTFTITDRATYNKKNTNYHVVALG